MRTSFVHALTLTLTLTPALSRITGRGSCALAVFAILFSTAVRAANLVVKLPDSHIVSIANAIERGSSIVKAGKPDQSVARFSDLSPTAVYDLAIEEKSGELLCGVDLTWCDATPADPQAEPLGDDDREAIRAIVQDIKGFANKPSILSLVGNHDRCVGLVNLVRDNGFHSNAGDEVIWRVEVWFFKWENGGWERVSNQSRILRRERFATHAEYQKEVERIQWIPQLGGIQIDAKLPTRTIDLTLPATRASGSTAASLPTKPADAPAAP